MSSRKYKWKYKKNHYYYYCYMCSSVKTEKIKMNEMQNKNWKWKKNNNNQILCAYNTTEQQILYSHKIERKTIKEKNNDNTKRIRARELILYTNNNNNNHNNKNQTILTRAISQCTGIRHILRASNNNGLRIEYIYLKQNCCCTDKNCVALCSVHSYTLHTFTTEHSTNKKQWRKKISHYWNT